MAFSISRILWLPAGMLLLCVCGTRSAPVCARYCEKGQYCWGKDCLPCPDGTFQKEPFYKGTECIPWTTKPVNSRYVIAKNGTSTSDVKWRCQDGFEEWEFAVTAFECRPIQTTAPPSSTPTQLTTTGESPVPGTSAAPVVYMGGGESLDAGQIAGIVISVIVFVLIIIVIVVLICAWKTKKWGFAKGRKSLTNGNPTAQRGVSGTEADENEPLSPNPTNPNPNSITYKFCLLIVDDLGLVSARKFFNVLDDPSGNFHAGKVLQNEASINPDTNTYLTHTFLQWIKCNDGIYRKLVSDALMITIKRSDILDDIEERFPILLSIYLPESNLVNEPPGADNGAVTHECRLSGRPDRFRLYYFLTEHVAPDILQQLLREIDDPKGKFKTAYNEFTNKKSEQISAETALADVIEEWFLRYRELSLSEQLRKFLVEKGRNDVLENATFQQLFQKIDSAGTYNLDSDDQGQPYSSSNSMSVMVDVTPVSYTDHGMPDLENDELGDTPDFFSSNDNTELTYVSDNTESRAVSDNTEFTVVSDNTELKVVPDNTELKVKPDNTVQQVVLGNTELKTKPDKAVPQDISNNIELKVVSGNTVLDFFPSNDNTELTVVSGNSESRAMSETADLKDTSNNPEAKDLSRDTRVQEDTHRRARGKSKRAREPMPTQT